MLQIEQIFYLQKKAYHVLVYEKRNILFFLLQLKNEIKPGQKLRYHQVFAGVGVRAGIKENCRV